MVANHHAPSLVQVIISYDALLQRYANKLVKNQTIAAALTKEVLELVYGLNGFKKEAADLRRQLKTYTYKACCHWLRVQSGLQNHPN